MGRRVGGLVIVLLVLLAAAIVPSALGRTVAGRAVLVPVKGPPAVGDCLTVPGTSGRVQGQGATYATQSLAACSGSRYGEVVAVIDDARSHDPAVPTIQTPSDSSTVSDDPNQQTCSDAELRYVGVPTTARPAAIAEWGPVTGIEVEPTGPDELQKKFGQSWVACVLYVNGGSGSVSYAGTAKNAFTTGELPAAFAVCVSSADLMTAAPVPCHGAHTVEAFAVRGTGHPGLTQQSLDTSCLAVVARMTKLSDPTAAGQLEVGAIAIHDGPSGASVPGLGGPTDGSGFAACVAVSPAGRTLTASLLALHGRPIPWGP